jgi:hypothetical protein
MDTPEKRRWYRPTPDWLVCGSLAVTGLLFASERWRWFSFNERKGYTVLISLAGVGVVLGLMLLWFVVALVFRWRFQFGIRTLLALPLAVALPFSWLGVEIKEAAKQYEAVQVIRAAGGDIVYDWEWYDEKTPSIKIFAELAPVPEWITNRLGDDLFYDVVEVDFPDGWAYTAERCNDGMLAHLHTLKKLRLLVLERATTSNEAVKELQQALPNRKVVATIGALRPFTL